jgi:hypothetical protein
MRAAVEKELRGAEAYFDEPNSASTRLSKVFKASPPG